MKDDYDMTEADWIDALNDLSRELAESHGLLEKSYAVMDDLNEKLAEANAAASIEAKEADKARKGLSKVSKQFNIAYDSLKECLSKTSETFIEEICHEAFDDIHKQLSE